MIKYLIVIKFPKISPLYNFKLQEKETLALTRHFFSFLFGDDRQTFDEETSKKKGKKKEKTKAGRNQINRYNASVPLAATNEHSLGTQRSS